MTNLGGYSLNDVIQSQQLSEDHIILYSYQIVRALKYLHSVNIIHRDLKPSNITVTVENEIRV